MAQINEWLSIDKANGSGDATITLTASSSTELTERMASLEIKGTTKSVYINITQNAYVAPPLVNNDYFWVKLEEDGWIGLDTIFEYSYDRINWQSTPNLFLNVPADTYVWIRNKSAILNAETITEMTFSQRGSIGGNLSSMGDMRDYNFRNLFFGNENLVDASELILPWDTSAEYCYHRMFMNCTSLTKAPVLPATELAESCYEEMFEGCTSLTTAPELPATTLADYCYMSMFYGCTSLTKAPELPATNLGRYCYNRMFRNCTSLTTAPALPATTLVEGCYYYMFYGCTSLTTAPVLLATTLATDCYMNMFYDCSSLTEIEIGKMVTDISSSYHIFDGCTNLKTIIAHPSTAPTISSLTFYGVARNGTLIYPTGSDYSSWLSTNSYYLGYYGWTTQTQTDPELPTDVENCFYIEPADSSYNGTYTIWSADDINENYGWDKIRFYYYQDNTWKEFRCKKSLNELNYLSASGRVYIKDYYRKTNAVDLRPLNCSIEFNVGGDITTLLGAIENPIEPYYGSSGGGKGYCYAHSLFRYSNLYSAKELILPNKTDEACYSFMFGDCSKLVFPPQLPATELAESCYSNMFSNSTSLTTAPELPATILAEECYRWMFSRCTSLTTAPVLPATILSKWCYVGMFIKCSKLSRVECHAEVINADDYCLSDWLVDVSPTGTFIKKQGVTYPSTNSTISGDGGIPKRWTIQEIA